MAMSKPMLLCKHFAACSVIEVVAKMKCVLAPTQRRTHMCVSMIADDGDGAGVVLPRIQGQHLGKQN